MNKKQSQKKKTEALKEYLRGTGRDITCKKLKLSHNLYQKWKKDGEWEKMYQDKTKELRQKVGVTVNQEKERTLTLIRAIEALYARQLNDGMPIKTSEFAQIQKVKWELLMPKTISQYNFMKTENNKNINITKEELDRLMRVLNKRKKDDC